MKVVYVVMEIKKDLQDSILLVEAFRSEHKNKAKKAIRHYLASGFQAGKRRYCIIEEYELMD
jgi:hypothetical protein